MSFGMNHQFYTKNGMSSGSELSEDGHEEEEASPQDLSVVNNTNISFHQDQVIEVTPLQLGRRFEMTPRASATTAQEMSHYIGKVVF